MINFIQLTQYIEPKRVLDIGAHVGDFTKQLASMSPNCEFILVEANPYCEEYLKKLNQPYKILALSNQTGTTHLYVEKANSIGTGASLYKENTEWYGEGKYEIVEVPTDTLDNQNFFPEEVIDLVKLDVQGSELDILYGGRKTIKRTKYVLIEVSLIEYNLGAPLMDIIVNKMKEFGFGINDILEYHKLQNNQIFQLDILFKNSYID
jgi:FkbM family methyltransferase